METEKICQHCQKPLGSKAVHGLCTECLLKVGLGTEAGDGKPSGFVPPPVRELAPHFPQLDILEILGRGGMGAVYKARQKALNRWVALKVLPSDSGRDPAFAERFTREAQALARLNHPAIVAVYDFGFVETHPAPSRDGFYFFLMEYIDGVNLRQMLRAQRLSPREAMSIVPQICEALQYAHDQGVVHRDIKPENVLVDRTGRVKIADFGLAKLLGQQPLQEPLTRSAEVMGTPQYMAPEQVERPLAVDHRADIYSLGVVFYEMLTGELPLGRFPAPSRKVQVDIRLDDIVLRALEKEPELRYQQASVFKTEVETVANSPGAAGAGKASAKTSPGHSPRSRSPGVWIPLAIVGLLALLAFLFLQFGSSKPGEGASQSVDSNGATQAMPPRELAEASTPVPQPPFKEYPVHRTWAELGEPYDLSLPERALPSTMLRILFSADDAETFGLGVLDIGLPAGADLQVSAEDQKDSLRLEVTRVVLFRNALAAVVTRQWTNATPVFLTAILALQQDQWKIALTQDLPTTSSETAAVDQFKTEAERLWFVARNLPAGKAQPGAASAAFRLGITPIHSALGELIQESAAGISAAMTQMVAGLSTISDALDPVPGPQAAKPTGESSSTATVPQGEPIPGTNTVQPAPADSPQPEPSPDPETLQRDLAARLQAAKSIFSFSERDMAMARLAENAAQNGLADLARQALDQITSFTSRDEAAKSAARTLMTRGQRAEALKTAGMITSINLRDAVVREIANK